MAWDPNSSAWDWDAQGITTSRTDTSKSALTSWLNDTEACSSNHNGTANYTSRDIGSMGVRISDLSHDLYPDPASHGSLLNANVVVTPLMANLHGALVSNGEIEHASIDLMRQGRLPIVTTHVSNGGPMYTGGIDGLESVVQTSIQKKQEASLLTNVFEFGSQKQRMFGQHNQGIDAITMTKDDIAATKHHSSKMIQSCDGDETHVADEQHGGMAHGGSAGSGDSLTGLQLGKRTYSPDLATTSAVKAVPKSLTTSKKHRAGAAASQIPRCQVEGCKLELTSAKDYHRRHKVCEAHSKAVKVVVASREQRFCQQCSRFHVLTEFDESKRSCRRRLEGHNKRRRKPQPDPLELQARLRSTFEDWSFLQQPRYPRLSVRQDFGDLQLNNLWPRQPPQYEDQQPTYSYALPPLGTDMYAKDLPPSLINNKFPLLLLQSPKTMIPIHQSHDNRLYQYLPGLLGGGHVGNGLTLASSTGAGVFTGINTPPVTEVTRVVDSGRALSLLSLQLQCSRAADMVSLNLSSLENISTIRYDQHVQQEPQEFLLHRQQQQQQQLVDDNYLGTHPITSSMRLPSPSGLHESHVVALDKELFDCSSLVGDAPKQNGSYHVSEDLGSPGTKQTRNLMQLSSFKMTTSPQHESVVFPVGDNGLEGSQFSFARF